MMTPERIATITDRLDVLTQPDAGEAVDWRNGVPFSFLDILSVEPDRVNPATRERLMSELVTVGQSVSLTFRRNGNYCWFDSE